MTANKTYIIAGGSSGIGAKIASDLLFDGNRVVITGRNKSRLNSIYLKLNKNYPKKIKQFCGDISDISNLKKVYKNVIKDWKKIDGLVASAGNLKKTKKEKLDDWEWYYKNNFENLFIFLNFFINNKTFNNSSIVIIGSIAGVHDLGAPLPYKNAKRSLIDYGKFLAKVLANRNVKVNIISPGNILFKGGNWDKKLKENQKKTLEYIKKNVPMNAFGNTEDISNMVLYLLSEKSKFITGSNFIIDGGQILKYV